MVQPEARLSEIFELLLSRADDDGNTYADGPDLDRWSKQLDASWLEVLNMIGAELAKRYHAGVVSWNFGDSLVNDLWGEMIHKLAHSKEDWWPDLFDSVYLAFDSGEFQREKDGDACPIDLYTNPEIARIVASLD